MQAWERVQDSFDELCLVIAGHSVEGVVALDEYWIARTSHDWSESTGESAGSPALVKRSLEQCLVPTLPCTPLFCADGCVDALTPVACRFVNDAALLVQLPYAFLLFELPSKRLRWAVRGAPASILQIVPSLHHRVPHALVVQRRDVLPSVHLLALDSGRWLTEWQGVTPPPFPMARYNSNHWSVYDYAARTVRALRRPGNWKGGALLSPCFRYAWIEDTWTVVRLADDSIQLDLEGLPSPSSMRPENDESESRDSVQEDLDEDLDEVLDRRLAFVALPGRFRVFHRGVLSDCAKETARIPDPYNCACFSRHGTHLAIGRVGELLIHRIEQNGQLLGSETISLATVAERLTLHKYRAQLPAMTSEIESSLLNGFGTVDAIRAAPLAALKESVARYCVDSVMAGVVEDIYNAIHLES